MGAIYLYVILLTNNGRETLRTPHPSYASCLVALDHAKQSSASADSRTVALFCGDGRMEWAYEGKWHRYETDK